MELIKNLIINLKILKLKNVEKVEINFYNDGGKPTPLGVGWIAI